MSAAARFIALVKSGLSSILAFAVFAPTRAGHRIIAASMVKDLGAELALDD